MTQKPVSRAGMVQPPPAAAAGGKGASSKAKSKASRCRVERVGPLAGWTVRYSAGEEPKVRAARVWVWVWVDKRVDRVGQGTARSALKCV